MVQIICVGWARFCAHADSITISKDSAGGFLLLAWGGEDTIVSAFIKAFIDSGYDFIETAIARLLDGSILRHRYDAVAGEIVAVQAQ